MWRGPDVPLTDSHMKASDPELLFLLTTAVAENHETSADARALLCHGEALGNLRKELIDTLGWPVARGVLMRYGYHRGTETARLLRQRYVWDDDSECLRAGMRVLRLKGVADTEFEPFAVDHANGTCHCRGKWRDSYEAEEHIRHFGCNSAPACCILTGYFSGYATTLIGAEAICIEHSCMAQRNPDCRWELRLASDWGEEAEETKEALRQADLRRHLDQLTRDRRLATLSTYTAGLAHELKNPLNSALIQLHLLDRTLNKHDESEPELVDQCLKAASNVRDEVQRLTRLVEDFLLLARPHSLVPQLVSPRNLVDESVSQVESLAAERKVRIDRESPTEPMDLMGDPDKLKEAFTNLLTNSIEAIGDDGGSIKVTLSSSGSSQIHVAFADDGPGIPEAIRSQIFDVFYSTKDMGTGLGLPLAHRIIEEHGGTLELASGEGRGAEFLVTLPSAPPRD